MTSNSLKKPEKSLPFHWYYDSKVFQKEIDKIFNFCSQNLGETTISKTKGANKDITIFVSK